MCQINRTKHEMIYFFFENHFGIMKKLKYIYSCFEANTFAANSVLL